LALNRSASLSLQDQIFMKEALRLAAKGRGQTSPNPMVGAVIVVGETIVGRGYHERVGGAHAEINALRDAGDKAGGATLYVTLEPCNHHGRTPPCTMAVADSGITRVVVGMADPNPHVAGGGADVLRERGIAVEVGVFERECRLLNQAFIKHSSTGLPLVTIKVASTLDGRIATRSGDSRWISNERSRRFVHHLRCLADGILIGIDTALADDPQLTARLRRRPPCRQPIRMVLDSRLRLNATSHLARTARDVPVWAACTEDAPRQRELELHEAGVVVLRLPGQKGRVDLPSLLKECGRRQITSLLVEGGSRVVGAFIEQHLADDFYFFYGPKILGDPQAIPMVQGNSKDKMSEALSVYDLRVRRFGGDVMLSGRFHEELY
jgi:diaminohydroxyphosphoribosylaminopyrimidine deaminase / 5-amino-6-(5-phosphoribosylamino)uracil reductase